MHNASQTESRPPIDRMDPFRLIFKGCFRGVLKEDKPRIGGDWKYDSLGPSFSFCSSECRNNHGLAVKL